jgi:16S rRNA G966 N2-methylase RsmD
VQAEKVHRIIKLITQKKRHKPMIELKTESAYSKTLLPLVVGGLTITCEDNMELMSRYPDNYFDLAIVDPPYGIDLANMNMGIGKTKKASKAKNRKWKSKDWDNETPTKEYFDELFRVSKNQKKLF